MSNLTTPRDTPKKQTALLYAFPVLNGVVLPEGTMGFLSSGRYAAPGAASTAQVGLGRVRKTVDNTASSSPGLDVNGNPISVEIEPGIFRWANGDSIAHADVGKLAFSDDNQTAYKGSSSKSCIGLIVAVDSNGVWVYSSPELAMAIIATAADASAAQTTANAAVPMASVQLTSPVALVAGDVTISSGVTVTASSVIVPIRVTPDATAAHWGDLSITSPVVGGPGTGGFHIHSGNASDTSKVAALIIG